MWWLAAALAGDPLEEAVARAVDSRCGQGELAALEEAEPAAVRGALAAVIGARHAAARPGMHTRRIGELRGREVTYQLWLPEPLPEGRLPVMVRFAHPTDPSRYAGVAPDLPYALLFIHGYNVLYGDMPDRRYLRVGGQLGLVEELRALQDAALTDALARYPLDPDRLVCSGASASGTACWRAAQEMPDRWAGIWPISAGWQPFDPAQVQNLAHTPVRLQHGAEDAIIPDEWPRELIAAMTALGQPPTVVWLEGYGHGNHPREIQEAGVQWMLEQRRAARPAAIRYSLTSPVHPDAWWLHVRAVTVKNRRRIRSDRAASGWVEATWREGRVDVVTSGVASVALRWEAGPPGPGRGQPGDELIVSFNGRERAVILEEDPTVAVRAFCEAGDITRRWAGEITLDRQD